jgi:hypothetical protein
MVHFVDDVNLVASQEAGHVMRHVFADFAARVRRRCSLAPSISMHVDAVAGRDRAAISHAHAGIVGRQNPPAVRRCSSAPLARMRADGGLADAARTA